ncbi:Non-repetitive/WGA-negative nucleoporin C-terminal-domain-containing protein [Lipomyces arxii]|uniref:Non-repetitive/WGA-negative nucleoporin C-terminal-domain-containing protein n=1 Tax=Lipomyces arxii TaxID=56418 RepID=UPI0034CDB2C4
MATRRSSRLRTRQGSRQVSNGALVRLLDESAGPSLSGLERGLLLNQQSDSQYSARAKESAIEFTKNSKYCVLRLPALPNILRSPQEQAFNGSVDSTSASALILTSTFAYVWRYISPDQLPATISFPISNATGIPPLGVLVSPAAGSTEAGLVIVHPHTGNLMYWEDVGGAIAEGLLHRKKGVEANIGLYQGEVLDYLQNIEPVGVIAATSSGRFVLVLLHDSAGRPGVTCTVMRGSGTGIWANLTGALKVSATRRDIIAIKPGELLGRGERVAITANIRGGVTMWHCSRSGDYRLLFEMDLRDLLIRAIIEVYPQCEKTFQVHDIELLPGDKNADSTNKAILILASFTYDESDHGEQTFYVLFTVNLDPADMRVETAHRITCYFKKSGLNPKLYLPLPGVTAFIVLSNAVIMVDTVRQKFRDGLAYRWEDVVEFKDSVSVLTAGIEHMKQVSNQVSRHAGVVVIARGAGIVRIERFEDERSVSTTHSNADVIKSRLEQAVYYGYIDETPLNFEQREVGYSVNDIESAISIVSDETINATSPYSIQSDDIVESLIWRCQSLGHLAEHLSPIFPLLSVDCRVQTLQKLEQCQAAQNVWKLWFSPANVESRSKMIVEVISEMTNGTDHVEQFFTKEIDRIGEFVINFSKKSIIRAQTARGHRQIMIMHVKEANEMLISILSSSAYFIRTHYKQQVFQLAVDQWGHTDPWTATMGIIDSLEKQYQLTKGLCSELWELSDKGETEVDYDLRALCDQLDELAESICRAYDERIGYCASNENLHVDAESVKVMYAEQRGYWLKPLLAFGHGEKAFQLGEKYRDFRTLAEMCREEKAQYDRYDDDSSRQSQEVLAQRVKNYFDTYGYEFASVLYQFYIDNGYTTELFVSFPSYHTYLKQFLSSGKYDRMAWIHDIQTGDFAAAGTKLQAVASKMEDTVDNKLLQLSIAKLCFVSAGAAGAGNYARSVVDVNEELMNLDREMDTE